MNKCKANLEKFDGKCWLPLEKAPECGRVELVCTRWELVSFNPGDSEEELQQRQMAGRLAQVTAVISKLPRN